MGSDGHALHGTSRRGIDALSADGDRIYLVAVDRETGFASPGEAALASYSPAAKAHVVRVESIDDSSVDVIVDTEPSHPMRVHCALTERGWVEMGDIVE